MFFLRGGRKWEKRKKNYHYKGMSMNRMCDMVLSRLCNYVENFINCEFFESLTRSNTCAFFCKGECLSKKAQSKKMDDFLKG